MSKHTYYIYIFVCINYSQPNTRLLRSRWNTRMIDQICKWIIKQMVSFVTKLFFWRGGWGQVRGHISQKKMVALIILIIALQFDVSTSCNDSLRWRHPRIFPSQLRSHLFPVAMAKERPCCYMVTMVTRDDSLWWRKSALRAPADVTFSLAGYPI